MALMMVPSGLKAETAEMLQTSKITGVVIDDFGEPIIGATVRVKNAQNGAVTDVNGRYSVNATKNATLVFSFIGYRTQEVAVKGRTTVNVTLKEDSQMLEETVNKYMAKRKLTKELVDAFVSEIVFYDGNIEVKLLYDDFLKELLKVAEEREVSSNG